jgi:hypothetical protein
MSGEWERYMIANLVDYINSYVAHQKIAIGKTGQYHFFCVHNKSLNRLASQSRLLASRKERSNDPYIW